MASPSRGEGIRHGVATDVPEPAQRARDPGDVASWRRLNDIYNPLIRRWVRPYVDQQADVDDVAQDVLTALVRELPRFEHNGRPGAFRAWLRAITVNRLRVHHDERVARPRGRATRTCSSG